MLNIGGLDRFEADFEAQRRGGVVKRFYAVRRRELLEEELSVEWNA